MAHHLSDRPDDFAPSDSSLERTPIAPGDGRTREIGYDGHAGVGIRITPWTTRDGERRFIGLTFVTAFEEESHDLTPNQATDLAVVLAELA